MSIADAREKCKTLANRIPRDVFIVAVLLFASSASFGFGYLAGIDAGKGSADEMVLDSSNEPLSATSAPISTTGHFVASKNGTKYYLSSCAGADKISDANKVWFVSASAAEAAGYAPAANCKGL